MRHKTPRTTPPTTTPNADIPAAVEILRAGGLVAFPTETVYGLGADATNSAAVEKIFDIKGRPATNPLIVHVASADVAKQCAADWPPIADVLIESLWPGPLALVLPKAPSIVPQVTADKDTVAVRMPDHPVALALLREFAGPVAAPSANRANHISPTTADHVRRELGDRVDMILDGGPARIGIESTVLDISRNPPVILRLGGISPERIAKLIGNIEIFSGSADATRPADSPGQQHRHYAPVTPARRFSREHAVELLEMLKDSSRRLIILAMHPDDWHGKAEVMPMPSTPEKYAARLYAALHEADAIGAEMIWIEEPPQAPAWAAVRDRIFRATAQNH